jgi:hypothetical protein
VCIRLVCREFDGVLCSNRAATWRRWAKADHIVICVDNLLSRGSTSLMNAKVVPFNELAEADLIVDAVYLGGAANNAGDDPLNKLARCGNMGGFRKVGRGQQIKYVVLYSSQSDRNWPDQLDSATGLFTYYGDNKTPGSQLHDTTRGGNRLLAHVFDQIHASPSRRLEVPPFFVFTKAPLYGRRAVQFRGLAAPGANGVAPTDDLIAVWKSFAGQRFQNYKALFTVLQTPRVPRSWLADLQAGRKVSDSCPPLWRQWVDDGSYVPLVAEPAIETRTREEQLPDNDLEREIVATVYNYFKDNPTAFEACAAALVQFQNPENYVIDEITRRSVDGGRDAVGRYRLGPPADPITVDFALEAKCYRPNLPGQPDAARQVGVKETARLISRLRHRQFGVLVTTSYIGPQAYREIREDKHPVILLCGHDIARLLINKGYTSVEAVTKWLQQFPH